MAQTIGLFGLVAGLMAALYALSPGGLESGFAALAIGGLTLAAAMLFRAWDETRLLNAQNRGQNPDSPADNGNLP